MRKILLALALAVPCAAAAAPEAPAAGDVFTTRLHQRYCDKLRQGAEAYVLFVRRLAPIHAYTYDDFAPRYPGAPVKADCRVDGARLAEVRRILLAEVTPPAK